MGEAHAELEGFAADVAAARQPRTSAIQQRHEAFGRLAALAPAGVLGHASLDSRAFYPEGLRQQLAMRLRRTTGDEKWALPR